MREDRPEPAHAGAKRFDRRRLLGGFLALAGAGAVAAVMDEALSSGASLTGESGLAILVSEKSERPGSTPTSVSYVSRPDLQPPRVVVDVNKVRRSGLVFTDCHMAIGRPDVGQEGALVLEPDGEVVWFAPVPHPGTKMMNVRVQSYKGKPVLTYFQGDVSGAGHGLGSYQILDTSYQVIQTVQAQRGLIGDLHEFVITPEGTALFTAYGEAEADLSSVGGPKNGRYWYGEAQEVDLATGELVFYWRSDEHVGFEESHQPYRGGVWDYFHINSINVDPRDGNLVISSRMCWSAYKVNRHTGKIMWRLGGKKNDFTLGPGAAFSWQHDVTPQRGGTFTIFDNECNGTHEPSRALVLAVDEKKKRASVVRQFHHRPELWSGVLGSVQDLPGWNRFVGWGTTTYYTEYGPKGEVLLDGHLEGGFESYRAFKHAWSAIPSSPPAVAARRHDRRTLVYVSWNGATEVARWEVNSGKTPNSMRPAGSAAKKGFETLITLEDEPAYVKVTAIDSKGAAIGSSNEVKVS
jgi:hypothetical protein